MGQVQDVFSDDDMEADAMTLEEEEKWRFVICYSRLFEVANVYSVPVSRKRKTCASLKRSASMNWRRPVARRSARGGKRPVFRISTISYLEL